MESAEERHEIWAVSMSEEDRLEELSSDDELFVVVDATDEDGRRLGHSINVMVWRCGDVPAQRDVSLASKLVAEAADTLCHPQEDSDHFETTSNWLKVVVDPKGKFVRTAEPELAPGP